MEQWILNVMQQLGYWGIMILMFLDNVIPPIPSEVIMPSAGYTASQGHLNIIGVILAGCIGSLLAAALLYWLGSKCPNEKIFHFCDRYGKYIGIKGHDMQQALDWFEQRGHNIVLFGRMMPAIRSLISVPAGMSGMPFAKFILYSTLGTIPWTTFLALVGYYVGQNKALMTQIFSQFGYFILSIVAIVLSYFLWKKYQKNKR